MPEFSAIKGTLKLKNIDSIEILSERIGNNIYLHLQANLRSGKTRKSVESVYSMKKNRIHADIWSHSNFQARVHGEELGKG